MAAQCSGVSRLIIHVAIAGASIATLSDGTALVAAERRVAIFDKRRGAGRRMG
jgi:predicted NAD/FAD-dependent oxidoreductase